MKCTKETPKDEVKVINVPSTESEKEILIRNARLWKASTGKRATDRADVATFLRTIGMEWTPPTALAAGAQMQEAA